jgi:hypothetical protein
LDVTRVISENAALIRLGHLKGRKGRWVPDVVVEVGAGMVLNGKKDAKREGV